LRGTAYHPLTVTKRPFIEARLLTVSEVADLLRVSKMTVYRLINEGSIGSLRVGRSYRLREDDVDDYLSKRYTEAG
jgi:excisionase family DNA binding protein